MTSIVKELLFYVGVLAAMVAGLAARIVVADEMVFLSAVAP